MKVADLLEARRKNWEELDRLCAQMETSTRRSMGPLAVSRFAALYRAACADLALANAYQLPSGTVQYLHRLVGRSHNQLYRSRIFDFSAWGRALLVDAPRKIFNDHCVQVCFVLFWGVFLISAFAAASPGMWPDYVDQLMGAEAIQEMEEMYADGLGRTADEDAFMAGFYIRNNTGIGLRCFAYGLLVIPGVYVTIFNSAILGCVFGYMARPDAIGRDNFFEFVTAHGPFELTAIVLSAGAGLRLGMSWIITGGLSREASMQKAGREVMPIAGAMMILFIVAGLIEGFLSASPAPYAVKFSVFLLSILILLFYFFVLGFPWEIFRATR